MTFYAILITALLCFILGWEGKSHYISYKYRPAATSRGKRVKTDYDVKDDEFTPEEKTRIDEIKDELGATILDYQNHG